MYTLATSLCSVLRGTTTNAYGDVVDTATVVQSGIPASVIETDMAVFDPASQTPRTVRTVTAVLPSGTDVLTTDRLRDDTYGVTYAIEDVTQNRAVGRTPDLVLSLRRITS